MAAGLRENGVRLVNVDEDEDEDERAPMRLTDSRNLSSSSSSLSSNSSLLSFGSLHSEEIRASDMDEETADAADEEPLRVEEHVFCTCRTAATGFMLPCSACDEWFHPACLGMTDDEAAALGRFECSACVARQARGQVLRMLPKQSSRAARRRDVRGERLVNLRHDFADANGLV